MWRQRIRLTMGSRHGDSEHQINLHDQEIMYPEHRFWEHVKVSVIEVSDELYISTYIATITCYMYTYLLVTLSSLQENEMYYGTDTKPVCSPRRLPILALNEVFIGESLSARFVGVETYITYHKCISYGAFPMNITINLQLD